MVFERVVKRYLRGLSRTFKDGPKFNVWKGKYKHNRKILTSHQFSIPSIPKTTEQLDKL